MKAKNNLAPDKAALPYVIGLNTRVGHDEAAGTDISAPYIIWGNELVTVTANEAMHAAAIGGRLASVKREAEEFLRDRLADGRKVKTADLEEEAEAHGISKSTLKRARKELGVRTWKDKGLSGDWYLELPPISQPRGHRDDQR